MSDVEAAAAAIENLFDGEAYPAGFLAQYDQLECLGAGHGTETFLVRQKTSGQLSVAKCYDRELFPAAPESDILKSLRHSGLPAWLDEYQSDRTACTVREYVVGTPLDRYRAENELTERDAVGICAQLCDILAYLHRQRPPVIHRDIKPQNIIVKPNGEISLIDFDIARVYHDGAATDTAFIGTRAYAPPEQYGFSQTDARADIYAAGVVLGWLLTGEIDRQAAAERLANPRIAVIYRKCTAFSPEDRFSSAERLRSALLRAGRARRAAAVKIAAAALGCLALFGAGFSVGRYTDWLPGALLPRVGVTFREPLIEQAARLQLGKTAGEPITEEDLLSVTGLYIFGDSLVAESEEDLKAAADRLFERGEMRQGPITSLDDLAKMPNLKQVFLPMQQITDISPLAQLPNLEVAEIKNNPIADIAPLGELKFLRWVTLFDTRVTDFAPLSRCPLLTGLDAGKLPVRSPAAFAELRGLRALSLYDTALETLDGIEALTQLEFFEVQSVLDGDLTPLLALPHLKNVSLGENLRGEAEAALGEAAFEITYR